MANFMIRFLLCNVFISGIVGILLIAKWVFRNNLSSRMQYNLWLLLLGLLAVPFIPFRLISFPQIFSWLSSVRNSSASHADVGANNVMDTGLSGTTNWMNDFALSVNKDTPSFTGYILLGIWIVGMLAMMILVIKSSLRLRTIKRSALPLQNPEVRRLYNKCLNEMKITRNIPVYSTAFLKSPIIVGFLKPCIYLPIHLISDYHESDMRYMLLHELQHYRHKDAIAKYGNENVSGDLSTYWLESSLKISPVEQVELLMKLQNNSLGFSSENINAVKDSICLSSSNTGKFYGKTGTGRVGGQDVNGWFIGYIEIVNNTYFFATNIGADNNATGSNAAEITMSILSDMNIWTQ